jgi:integrase
VLSTRTLRLLHSLLNRAVNRAMARDKIKRNVVARCAIPHGRGGRPSGSLTLDQAKALLTAAEHTTMHAYVLLSLLTGARTEELRALAWAHVDLVGRLDVEPPLPLPVQVRRSVRVHGDTKTRKSRRTLALPSTRPSPAIHGFRYAVGGADGATTSETGRDGAPTAPGS